MLQNLVSAVVGGGGGGMVYFVLSSYMCYAYWIYDLEFVIAQKKLAVAHN